jgi:DNA recombination protein Rad52
VTTLTQSLKQPLDSSVVKEREQSGMKLSYVESWYVIGQLNEVFGFDGWDRETTRLDLIQQDTNQNGKARVAYTAQCVLTIRFPEGQIVRRVGTGFGNGFDSDPGKAHESAIKEAESDAMKRAAMTLGNRFGLALYDKTKANVVNADDAAKLLKQKATDRWKQLGGTPAQWNELSISLKSAKKANDGVPDFVMTTFQEGVQDLQGIYEYAMSEFNLEKPFSIGGSVS